MGENLDEFRDRKSSIFSSLRPKKDKTKKKKSGGSKSMFSSLLLANFEQQMQFDPSANFSNNFAFESRREISQELLRAECKAKVLKIISKTPPNGKLDDQIIKEDDDNDDESDCDSTESIIENGISLNLDPFHVYEIYEDVLYNILYHLNKDGEDDFEQPRINEDSALSYVKDAFGISENKHNEIFEKVKAKETPEITIDESPARDAVDSKLVISKPSTYCFLSPKINNYEALETHCCLVKILLKHELELSQAPHYYWSGKFSFLASTILHLHSEFRYLTETSLAFTKYTAFAEVHHQHPVDLKVFLEMLDALIIMFTDDDVMIADNKLLASARVFLPACLGMKSNIVDGIIDVANNRTSFDQLKTKDELTVKMFWEATKKLNDSFSSFVGKLLYESDLESIKIEMLRKMLMIINQIKKVEPPQSEVAVNMSFEESIKEAIKSSTSKYLSRLINKRKLKSKNNETRLFEVIRVVETASSDCLKAIDRFGAIFEEQLSFPYGELLYKAFEFELAVMVKPIVLEISNSKNGYVDKGENEIGVKLFQLYMVLKSFSDRGIELYGNLDFQMKDYFDWFSGGIDKWNKVSIFTALTRIKRAIEMDNLKPVDNTSEKSSSSVDIMITLHSVRTFWEELKFPNADDATKIVTNVSGDICRFANIYFDNIVEKVEKCDGMKNLGIFKVPLEICVAIANINYVSQEIQTLIVELTAGKAQDNARLQKMIGNSLRHGKSRVAKLIQNSINKMVPSIRKLMLEGAEVVLKGRDIGDRLMVYIEDSLITLRDELTENDFVVAKTCLWKTILDVFSQVIQKSLEVQRTPMFYSNLRTILTLMKESFIDSNPDTDNFDEKTKQLEFLLDRYGQNSRRLIHQYYKDRYEMQQQISKSPLNPFGVLSVECCFFNNTLKLNIWNARNLIPVGTKNKCDSFVKIQIVPEDDFPTFQNYKTRVEYETHFPLYEEHFEFDLTSEQRNMKDAIIFFNIKDKVLLGSNQCLAEAFLSFNDIPEFSHQQKMTKQIHLTLTRLQSDDMESLKALQLRSQSGDKAAKEFLTKTKSKLVNSTANLKTPVISL